MPIDNCVDIKLSLLLSNSKPQLAAELLGMLMTELPQHHLVINRALNESRFKDALELIHALHGSCCYCGVPQLKEICKKLEQQLRTKKDLPALDDIHTFNKCVNALLAWHQNHDIHVIFSLDK